MHCLLLVPRRKHKNNKKKRNRKEFFSCVHCTLRCVMRAQQQPLDANFCAAQKYAKKVRFARRSSKKAVRCSATSESSHFCAQNCIAVNALLLIVSSKARAQNWQAKFAELSKQQQINTRQVDSRAKQLTPVARQDGKLTVCCRQLSHGTASCFACC